MGQDQSVHERPPPTKEEFVRNLAGRFADKCYTPLEIYSLKDNFKNLADTVQDVRYLKEDTIARFLEIPDVLRVSPVLFQAMSYLGAFPFLRDAPAVLGLEQLVIAITILSDRWKRVLKSPSDRTKLLFQSLAVYDRKMSRAGRPASPVPRPDRQTTGFAVDEAGDDEADDGDVDEDDDLVLAAFESLDCVDVFRHGDATPGLLGAMIPADNFVRVIMLLLVVAPLHPQERLSQYSDRLVGNELEKLHATAKCIIAAFLDVDTVPGLTYPRFRKILPACCPYMFDTGFNALFTHFLFSKNLDFSRPSPVIAKDEAGTASSTTAQLSTVVQPAPPQPLLSQEGEILDANLLAQLSFFLPGDSLFRRLRLLYSGDEDGFSMGSFESKVFNWRAPTLLLVRGHRLSRHPEGTQESTFAASMPPCRFPSSSKIPDDGEAEDETLTFGAYVAQPWRHTHRECFGDASSVLFQLGPAHDVFRASTVNSDYAGFTKPAASAHGHRGGVSFGCPPAFSSSSKALSSSSVVSLGAVSLFLDSALEFGAFTHDYTTGGGGAYARSVSRPRDFQDRFAVDSLEVWGCGDEDEAKRQAERWAWEAKEAEARRRINLGTGDLEADRALLEMAGLVGQNRSGGSMV